MKVKIVSVESKGLTIKLDDETFGFVPRKELSWSRTNPSPSSIFKIGEYIKVARISHSSGINRSTFSIRRMFEDPWVTRAPKYNIGQDVFGKVASIFEDAIFVEIEEGVNGRIVVSEIGPSSKSYSSQDVSLGDLLRVRILSINEEHKNFTCSNRKAIEDLKKQSHSPSEWDCSLEKQEEEQAEHVDYSTGSLNILLIDDDTLFCKATKRAFELSGHELTYCTNPQEGIDLAKSGKYDIVVIDMIMPEMDGLDVYKSVRETSPDIHMVIFTGETSVALDKLNCLDDKPTILHKPFDISDVEAACFQEIKSDSDIVPEVGVITAKNTSAVTPIDEGMGYDDYVVTHIQKLLKNVEHSFYGVFKWTESAQRLKFLHGDGFDTTTKTEQMERQLFYSPLKNVAEDKEIIFIPSVPELSQSYKKTLQNIFPFTEYFESLYCAPIIVHDKSRYVIAYMHSLPNHFSEREQEYIMDKHHVVGSELAMRETYKQTEFLQKFALRGELTASLSHEIRNRLHILSMNLKTLKKLGPRAEHKLRQEKSTVPNELGQLNEILEESQTALDKISEVVSSFSEDIAERGASSFDLTSLVRSVVSRLKLMATRKHVPIFIEGEEICEVTGSNSRIGQVIENLVLNAIQHTEILRTRDGAVRLRYGKDKTGNNFFVDVIDNGEGIHAKDFNRIFEMGFTTKETGSGVGLALCAAAMRSLGGRVYVKQSVLFEGTAMRVEWTRKGI